MKRLPSGLRTAQGRYLPLRQQPRPRREYRFRFKKTLGCFLFRLGWDGVVVGCLLFVCVAVW